MGGISCPHLDNRLSLLCNLSLIIWLRSVNSDPFSAIGMWSAYNEIEMELSPRKPTEPFNWRTKHDLREHNENKNQYSLSFCRPLQPAAWWAAQQEAARMFCDGAHRPQALLAGQSVGPPRPRTCSAANSSALNSDGLAVGEQQGGQCIIIMWQWVPPRGTRR